MRIAYLSVSDQLGGSEIALLETIAGVRALRPAWALQVILPGRGPLLERAEAAGADCVVLPLPRSLARLGESAAEHSRWSLGSTLSTGARLLPVAAALPAYLRALRRVLRASQPDVLHTNGLKAHVVGVWARGGSKIVWHMHEYIGTRRVTRMLLNAAERDAAAIVANSASVAADVSRTIAPSARVTVIHNAVDLQTFSPDGPSENLDVRAGLPPPTSPVVRVGLVATFARWKGHETFLRALAALPSTTRDTVRGYIIGAPLYETGGSQHTMKEIEALVHSLGLRDRVGLTGFLPAAPAIRALDIVVHSSTRPEPFGLVIAEAMACGRAVIVSAAGGAQELVEPEQDALAHPPGDAEALSRCIARLIGDPSLRRQLGARARAAACRRFDPARLARETVAVYEQIVH